MILSKRFYFFFLSKTMNPDPIMKSVTLSFAQVEFIDSIFSKTPMRTLEEIELSLRGAAATKPLIAKFATDRKALFEEMAEWMRDPRKPNGGGKVKQSEMVRQVPPEKGEEYQAAFLKLANAPVKLVLRAEDIAELLKTWIMPEWIADRQAHLKSDGGITSSAQKKAIIMTRAALEKAEDTDEAEAVENDSLVASQEDGE